jgi:RNA polymerase sigma factor (sigma-70 family)
MLAEEHRTVLAAVDRLAPRQREVLVLRYWSDLSEAQIADALGLSRGAVKSTASRAIDALEKMLETSR